MKSISMIKDTVDTRSNQKKKENIQSFLAQQLINSSNMKNANDIVDKISNMLSEDLFKKAAEISEPNSAYKVIKVMNIT